MSYHIKDYMSKDVVTIEMSESALAASKLMTEKEIGYIIVVSNSKPTGMITERDLVMRIMAKEKDPSKVKVSEVMSAPLITIDLNASVEDAVNMMAKYKIRRLPVVGENRIYGVFTTRDLTKNFSKYEDRVTRDLVGAQDFYGNSPEVNF